MYICTTNSVNVVVELSQGGFDAKYGGRGGTVIHCGWLGGTWRYRDNIHVSMRYAGFILTMSIPMLVKHEAILYICRFNEKSIFFSKIQAILIELDRIDVYIYVFVE